MDLPHHTFKYSAGNSRICYAMGSHKANTTIGQDREDSIRWPWTADGEYTAKSAYNNQFQGTFSKLKFLSIWKAKDEPKCRFFA